MRFGLQRRKRKGEPRQQQQTSYKFDNEETSYDRIMKVLNNQQSRIINMLKKYGDEDADVNYQNMSTITSAEATKGTPAVRSYSLLEDVPPHPVIKKSQPISQLVPLRLQSLSPSRKYSVLSMGTENLYNMYGYSDMIALPYVKAKKQKRQLSMSTNRRSKQQVIQSVYRPQFKEQKPKKKPQSQKEKTKVDEDKQQQPPTVHLQAFQESSESDKEQPLPLAQYYKEFRETVRKQTVQQMNFLYFSKNESMKNWTESVLRMFEKHDKELRTLRKKTRYLEKFDQFYFTSDAFVE